MEPLPGDGAPRRVLVAGIGNVFHGDDGFGVEAVRRLAERPAPPGVDVIDFGIRGIDLMYALQGGYATVVLVDAAERGHPPGTVSLVEPGPGGLEGAAVDGHGLDPARVLRLARESGSVPPRVLLVACEPSGPVTADTWEMALSAPVAAAVDEAVRMIERILAEETAGEPGREAGQEFEQEFEEEGAER
ncbi:hydrogenase maturation protease [Actinomadura roseirufa]|uniref:hydrogenase maturation protease n=1 Tax=Actinomadura roseirufa TaxID=2094049 RepID=UPI001F5FDDDF|nr:hydrogenase maturation protease [Actinomadura roseirufa]